MVHSSARCPPEAQSGWTHTLVTILNPSQVSPPLVEGAINANNTAYSTTNRKMKAERKRDSIDWNGSPYVHPLARRNTNPRSAQRHHRGAIWRHLLSSAVYKDLKREEEKSKAEAKAKATTKASVEELNNRTERGRPVVIKTLSRVIKKAVSSKTRGGDGMKDGSSAEREPGRCIEPECGTHQFDDAPEPFIPAKSETSKGGQRTEIKKNKEESEHLVPEIQTWRRFVRVECMGLSGVLFYELSIPYPSHHSNSGQAGQGGSMSNPVSRHAYSGRAHRRQDQQNRSPLTLESVFGDLDDPNSPSMHIDDLLDAVKAKICYFPAYACTSFIVGQAMLAFYRDQPELRPLPCPDGFSVGYPPLTSRANAKGKKPSTKQSNAIPSWKDGTETAPFLGDSIRGSGSMAFDLDEEDPYRMLMIRSSSHPISTRSGVEMAMAYGNLPTVSMEELEDMKEKDDAKRDSGYGSITGVLGVGSSVFAINEGETPATEDVEDLTLDTIAPLTPPDTCAPLLIDRTSEKSDEATIPIVDQGDKHKLKSTPRGLPTAKFASLTNLTNVTKTNSTTSANVRTSPTTPHIDKPHTRNSISRPFGIAASMPAISAIMATTSIMTNISVCDTFASFLDFLEPADGDMDDIVDLEKGLVLV